MTSEELAKKVYTDKSSAFVLQKLVGLGFVKETKALKERGEYYRAIDIDTQKYVHDMQITIAYVLINCELESEPMNHCRI